MNAQRGYIALTAVLVILAATIGIAITANLLSIDQNRFSVTSTDGIRALGLARGCLDEGLLRLKNDNGYGGGNLSVTDGSCTITVAGADTNRTLTSAATVEQSTRTVSAEIDLSSGFTFTSWQEE